MAYELFSSDYSRYVSCEPKDPDSLKIRCERISLKLSGWKNVIQWNIAAFGKVKAYIVYDHDTLVHFSYVVWGQEKFKFLHNGDIEIGPCWTHPDYRGLGIYPAVLSHIIQKELAGGGTAYMIIHDSNKASQRGVEKAGFRKTGDILEKDKLKRYHIVNGKGRR